MAQKNAGTGTSTKAICHVSNACIQQRHCLPSAVDGHRHSRHPSVSLLGLLVNLQGRGRLGVQCLEERGVVGELGAVAWDHLEDGRAPSGHLAWKALGKHIETHLHSSGCPRRSTEQAADAAIPCSNDLRSELQDASLLRVLLHDLHALSGCDETPVLGLGVGHEDLELAELLGVAGQELLHKVHREVEVLEAGGGGRDEVVQPDGLEEVHERARLQVPGAEAREGPEEDHVLAPDDALVEVRHRHGRRADSCLPVDLVGMLVDNIRVLADKELAADGEPHETLDLGNPRLLQHEQRPATGPNEDKPGAHLAGLRAEVILLDGQEPAAVLLLLQACDRVVEQQVPPELHEAGHKVLRERAEVDVRAHGAARQGNLVRRVAAVHHQGAPLLHRLVVVRVLHALEERVLRKGIVTCL
mmetsp:Transcript_71620/g.203200  ORF Transcript_71620/g.203200 Transcript_71620/m.203200 type:complete len:415 (-) Transcript_71620:653-1897(-)